MTKFETKFVRRIRARPRKEPTAVAYGLTGALLIWWATSRWIDYAHGQGDRDLLLTILLTASALVNVWRAIRAFRAEIAKER